MIVPPVAAELGLPFVDGGACAEGDADGTPRPSDDGFLSGMRAASDSFSKLVSDLREAAFLRTVFSFADVALGLGFEEEGFVA